MKRSVATLFFLLVSQAHAGALGLEGKTFFLPSEVKKCSGYDLFEAVEKKDASCLKQATEHMDVNDVNDAGETPLHVAIRTKNAPAILFLIRNGADLNKINFSYQTPKLLAAHYGFVPLVRYFESLERESERLLNAIEFNDVKKAKSSIRRGAALGVRDTRLDTFLHRAAQSGFLEMGKLLIRSGANLEARNYLGETPLHAAALRDNLAFMKLLLESGANPNAINERRQTPLDIAEIRAKPSILRLLKKFYAQHGCGADVPVSVSGGE